MLAWKDELKLSIDTFLKISEGNLINHKFIRQKDQIEELNMKCKFKEHTSQHIIYKRH